MIDLYGRVNCPFCEMAKAYLDAQGLAFNYKDAGNEFDRSEMFARNPGAKTVPQIFVGSHKLGGYEDLIKIPISTLQQLSGEK